MEKIKLSELIQDIDKYNEFMNLSKYINPKNVLDCEPIQKKAWGKIKEYQYRLNKYEFTEKDFIELFEFFTGKKQSDILKMDSIDFFYQTKWIVDELFKLSEKEAKALHSQLTPEQIEAGYEDLNIFGYKATTHALAGKDILKHDLVEALPYEQVFAVLYMEKVSNDIDMKMWEIRKRNNKI